MSRPMTSRQAHRAYLASTRVPRLSKAEERRMEREEQERIRNELKQQQAQARAQAAREKKKAKEEEARREKKRRGEPLIPVTASQAVISGFLKKASSVSKGSGTGSSHENVKNAGGVASKGPPAGRVGGEGTRDVETLKGPGRGLCDGSNSSSPVVRIAKDSPQACHSNHAPEPPRPSVRGEGKRTNEEQLNNPSPTLPKKRDSTPTSAQNKASKHPKLEGSPGPGRTAEQGRKHLESPVLTDSTDLNARAGDGEKSNAKPAEEVKVGETGLGDGDDLDDLFLSASQLVREVEEMPPPPTRKRSRDEAFPPPEPPAKHPDRTNRTKESPKLDTADEYDLGISSQELLQLDALEPPPERPPIQRPDTETRPEPPAPDISFSDLDSFFLCSQELRDLDALVTEVPPKTKHPTNTNPAPRPTDRHTEERTSGAESAKEPKEPLPSTTHANTTTNEQDTKEAQDDPEPQRFFTSCTQELISLAEKRSRATAEAEARRRRNAAKPPSKPKDARCDTTGNGGGLKAGGTMPAQAGGAEARSERSGGRGLRRSSSLIDDEWWEELEDTDLEALLGV